MKYIFLIVIIFFSIIFINCYSIDTSYGINRIGETSISNYTTQGIVISNETLVVAPVVKSSKDFGIKIGRLKRNDEIIVYYFRIESWYYQNILRLRIDDQEFRIHHHNEIRRHVIPSYFSNQPYTTTSFLITNDVLDRLISANTIIFFLGHDRHIVTVNQDELERIKDFIQ